MFLQHTQDVKVVFTEESVIELLKEYVETNYYQIKYNNYDMISSEIEIDENRKAIIKLRFQKIETTIDSTKKDEDKTNE